MPTTSRASGDRPLTATPPDRSAGVFAGPVMLVTFASAPFAADAVELAVGAAREHGTDLLVVNVVASAGGRAPHADHGDPPDIAARLREPVDRAVAAGVSATVLRVRSPDPRPAIARVAVAARPALVVVGGARRRDRRAVRALRTATSALLWSPAPLRPLRMRLLDAVIATACRWPASANRVR